MATIANLANEKFKAIVKKDGRILKTKTFPKRSRLQKLGPDVSNLTKNP